MNAEKHTPETVQQELRNEKELNDGLSVIEMEERLEMVKADDDIVISCCLDG